MLTRDIHVAILSVCLSVRLSVLELAIYASYAITVLMAAAAAYRVVTLRAQLTRDLLAIAKFLV